MGHVADLMSTLDIMVDGIENGTNVTCQIFMNEKSVIIFKEGETNALWKCVYIQSKKLSFKKLLQRFNCLDNDVHV